MELAAKWSRRHRTLVAATFFVLTFAAAILASSTVLVIRKQKEVERQRDEARRAVDVMYTEVATRWLSQQASLEPVQQQLLQKSARVL